MKKKKEPDQTLGIIALILSLIALMGILTSCEKPVVIADWECTNTVVRTIPGYLPDTLQYVTIYRARSGQEIAEMERNQIFVQSQLYNGQVVYIESKCTCHQICENNGQ